MKSPRDYALKHLEKELPVSVDVCLGIPIPGSTSQPGSAFRVAPSTSPSGHDQLLNRGACLSWAEAMDKELAKCVWLHEEEATLQFPLSLPPTPSPQTSRPALFNLLSFGLLNGEGFEHLQQVDKTTFLNEIIHLIQQDGSHHSFYRAFGAWMTRDNADDEDHPEVLGSFG